MLGVVTKKNWILFFWDVRQCGLVVSF